MFDILSQVDSDIFLFFNNGLRSPFADRLMMLFTGRFVWIPMYVAVLLVFARSGSCRNMAVLTVALVAAVAVTDQTCATFIRPMVERMRPSNLSNPLSAYAMVVDGYRGGAYGFPSCHAANSFALAVFLVLAVRRRAFSFFIVGWAFLNSYSRLYLGVHYPGDLLVGALIGSASGWMCYAFASRLLHLDRNGIGNAVGAPLLVIPVGLQGFPVLRVRTMAVTADGIVMAIGAVTTLTLAAVAI